MRIQEILSVEEETKQVLDKFKADHTVRQFSNSRELKACLMQASKEQLRKYLLVAARDETVAIGREYRVATVAYASPEYREESFHGVAMVIEGFEEVDSNFLEKVYERYHGIPWTIGETKRCIIRELAPEDLDELFHLYRKNENCMFLEALYEYEEEKRFQEAYIENMYGFYGYGMWLVFSVENGELIGRAGLEHREYNGETELELGYFIDEAYRRKGYGREVCRQILRIAREITDFTRINCLIDCRNTSSILFAESLGFSHLEDMETDGRKMSRFVCNLSDY